MSAPQYPAGPHQPEDGYGDARRLELIAEIEQAPARLRAAVAGLSAAHLDTPYKAWTVRQLIHHLADSHVHIYIRFKWTLTEDRPTIKPYHEGKWAALDDSCRGDVGAPLALLEATHRRWVQLMRSLTPDQWGRTFHHPETDQTVTLTAALDYYAWHCRHHIGQIEWMRSHDLIGAR